tara:strand:- start:262 stop:513 length:252 start_codon:yes stop_codon:yes gene_type:complete
MIDPVTIGTDHTHKVFQPYPPDSFLARKILTLKMMRILRLADPDEGYAPLQNRAVKDSAKTVIPVLNNPVADHAVAAAAADKT